MSQSSKLRDFLTTIFWTLKYSVRTQTYMNCCIKSLFIQNKHLKGLVKRQWAGSILGWVSRFEYQVLGSTSIPARLDTLVYWEAFSWLTSVGAIRNTVIRLGWSRIELAVPILHAAGVGLTDRPAIISGHYNKYHSLQLQNYYAHFPALQQTHTFMQNTTMRNWS